MWFTCKSISYTLCACLYTVMNHCITQRLPSLHHRQTERGRGRGRLCDSPCLQHSACRRHRSFGWIRLREMHPLWCFVSREGHQHTTHSQRILPGLVAWQRQLIGLARLRKGLARAGGIRSLPLIILSLSSTENWGRSYRKNLSHALVSEWGVITRSEVAGLFGRIDHHPTNLLQI